MPYNELFPTPTIDDVPWQTGMGRVWGKFEYNDPFQILACAVLGPYTYPQPDITPLWCQDPSRRLKFTQVGTVAGTPGRVEVSLMMRLSAIHFLKRLQERGCAYHLDARFGSCGRPDDADDWTHIVRFCEAYMTQLAGPELTMMDDASDIQETATMSAADMYDLYQLRSTETFSTTTNNLRAVAFCDQIDCGCGTELPSDGCQTVYAVTEGPALGSPDFLVSTDGGVTWTTTAIAAYVAGEDISDIACVGSRILITTEDVPSMAYTEDVGATWTEVTLGFLAGCAPTAIAALDPSHVWIAAMNGTVYFTGDITNGVEAQENGTITAATLNDIVAISSQRAYAVGDNNTFIYTENGATWVAGTGPLAGEDLATIYVHQGPFGRSIIVGTRNGLVYQSYDDGTNWIARTLPGMTGTFNIPAIVGCGCGGLELMLLAEPGTYLAPTGGQMFRSIDGGVTWREVTLPTNLGVEDISCCSPNYAVVVGTVQATGLGFTAVVSGGLW